MSDTKTYPIKKDLAFFKSLIEEKTTVEVSDEYTAPTDVTSLYQAMLTVDGVPHEITLRMFAEENDATKIELQLASAPFAGVLKVQYWYYDVEQGFGFMTYDASALKTFATEAPKLTTYHVLRILCLVGETLVALHDNGVAHNDVCEENIFIKNGDPLLTGFYNAQRVSKNDVDDDDDDDDDPFADDVEDFKELIRQQCDNIKKPKNKKKIAALLELDRLDKIVAKFSDIMKYYSTDSAAFKKKKKAKQKEARKEPPPLTVIRTEIQKSGQATEANDQKPLPQQQPRQQSPKQRKQQSRKEEPKSIRGSGKRLLLEDIATMTMTPANTFADGEVCGVPRSSGGFVYATVERTEMRRECGWDKTKHDSLFCRVAYAGEDGKPLFKDVTVGVLAKLLPRLPEQQSFSGIVPAAVAQSAVFSKTSKFSSGELVAVCCGDARGLRCGVVVDAVRYPCESGLHETKGWTVIVGKESEVCLPTIAVGKARQELFRTTELASEEDGSTSEESTDVDAATVEPQNSSSKSPADKEPQGKHQEQTLTSTPQNVVLPSSTKTTTAAVGQELMQTTQQHLLASMTLAENTANATDSRESSDTEPLLKEDPGRTIVIDGANVAAEAGRTCYSIKGLLNCINYYKDRKYDVVVVIPRWLTRDGFTKAPKKWFSYDVIDRELLNQHLSEFTITPDGGYDDSYALQIAFNDDGCIVSNDKYKDTTVVSSSWLQGRRIGFSFLPNLTFLPDPDFVFPQRKEEPKTYIPITKKKGK